MAAHMQDHTERMRVIKGRLEGRGSGGGGDDSGNAEGTSEASVAEKEELLDELVEIVENIDYARRVFPDEMTGIVRRIHEDTGYCVRHPWALPSGTLGL